MSHFYGTLLGCRGEATRCGSIDSGMRAVAASWEGAIAVDLCRRENKDMACVRFIDWHGKGVNRTIYSGPVSGGPLATSEVMELLAHCVDEKTNEKTRKAKCVRLSIPEDVYKRMKQLVLQAVTGRE